jgi:hypothetical protein
MVDWLDIATATINLIVAIIVLRTTKGKKSRKKKKGTKRNRG